MEFELNMEPCLVALLEPSPPLLSLHRANHKDHESNLRIVLKFKKKLVHLEQPMPIIPDPATATSKQVDAYYEVFIQNYNMHSMGKTIVKLHAMLKLTGKGVPKKVATPVPKILLPPKRENPTKDSIYHHCKEAGHWRENYPGYLVEYMILVMVLIFVIPRSLRRSKKMKHEALNLYVGNGMCAVVEAIGSFGLVLSIGLIIVLDNCYYAPSITRGVVSFSRLVNNGYICTIMNNGIYVSKDDVFYFNAIPHDGIYEIDMHNLYPNVSSMYNVSNKRAKRALDSTYLWHCRIGHINKKRIEKL
ncbi:zinc finger, CCHC-type containing protein [Tanacetum coccineum]